MRDAPLARLAVASLIVVACGGAAPSTRATQRPSASPPPPVTTSAPPTTGASTALGPPPGTTPPRTAPPTASPSATPTVTRAAVPATPPGPCAMSDTGISTTTDAPRYATGQTIQISVAVRNVSAHHCVFGAPGNLSVVDGSGPVFVVHLQCAPSGCPALPPGATSTYPISWNQLGNQPGASYEMPVPSGTYHAQAAFSGGYPVSSSAPFVIGG